MHSQQDIKKKTVHRSCGDNYRHLEGEQIKKQVRWVQTDCTKQSL